MNSLKSWCSGSAPVCCGCGHSPEVDSRRVIWDRRERLLKEEPSNRFVFIIRWVSLALLTLIFCVKMIAACDFIGMCQQGALVEY